MTSFLFIFSYVAYCNGWSHKYEYITPTPTIAFYLMEPKSSLGYPHPYLESYTWCQIKEVKLKEIKRNSCTLQDSLGV